jgi:hypothetical protein
MKTNFLVFAACAGFLLYGCGEGMGDSRYVLDLPEIPWTWELLGNPHWRIDWLNVDGRKETMTVTVGDAVSGRRVEIDLPQTWVSAVSALPFWPEKGIIPGIFRPAGAIFPFDVSGKSLVLSWQGGVDATLYWEFAAFSRENTSSPEDELPGEVGYEDNNDSPETEMERAAVPRFPWNFNWPRFRQLFDDPSLNAEVRADPWLADWHSIAEKIVRSGFDKRRLVPEPRSSLQIPVGHGPWIGTSPFATPLLFEATPVFPVRAAADTWVSAEGILRCNAEAWIVYEGYEVP